MSQLIKNGAIVLDMSMKKKFAILITAITWLCVSFLLFYKSKNYLVDIPMQQWIGWAIFSSSIGILKGTLILRKSAKKLISYIMQGDADLSFFRLFPLSYFILLGCMMSLGLLIRFMPINSMIKGIIDIGVGTALFTGSLVIFGSFFNLKSSVKLLDE